MKKALIITFIAVIAISFMTVKYFTTFFDSKDTAIAVNESYPFKDDFSDKRKVSGASDNIFIGEVIEETGTEEVDGKPNTQYSVRITQNIKGGFLGDITVNQQGGYYKDKGKLYLRTVEKDKMLEPGQMYLFVTSKNTKKEWQEVLPKFGITPLDTEDEKLQLIDEFKEAIVNEIVPNRQ